jgi:hypothetical protein
MYWTSEHINVFGINVLLIYRSLHQKAVKDLLNYVQMHEQRDHAMKMELVQRKIRVNRISLMVKMKREVSAYIAQKKGVPGTPLVYLVCRDDETHELYDEEDSNNLLKRIVNAPLSGNSFTADNFEL